MSEVQTLAQLQTRSEAVTVDCEVAVIWIDWYAYHIGRYHGLVDNPRLRGRVRGIEIVGGVGVHAGLKFREQIPQSFGVTTLFPENSWSDVKGLRAAKKVWKTLTELNPRTVLVPGYYTWPGLASAAWSKVHQKRSVLMTESTEGDHRRSWWKELPKRILLRTLFDWAIAGGSPHKRYLTRLGFRADRIGRFYDIVDNKFFEQQTRALRVHAQAEDFGLPSTYFLYVGRLAEEKNVPALLHSYLEYRRSGGTWPLVIVGDGPARQQLEQVATSSAYGADIRFEGLRSSGDLPQYYAFAGCFVLPSIREPWGLVVNEAMASALPVIVSAKCGCVEDLVREGENGFVFDPIQQRELTATLFAMSEITVERRKQMGARSLEIVGEYSPENWAEEVARIASAS